MFREFESHRFRQKYKVVMLNTRTKFYFFLIAYLSLFLYATVIDFTWQWVAIGIVLARIFSIIGIDLGYHRLWSHKAFKSAKWFEYVMMICAILAYNGSSIMYVGTHRMHHAFSDTDKDPHGTIWWKICLYMYEVKEIPIRVISDVIRNPFHRWCHKHYFKIHTAILIMCLIDPVFFGHTIGAIVFGGFLFTGAVNVLAHRKIGYRNFDTDDNSTNIRWLQIWSLHEGLHNNHHHDASAYDFAMKPGEYDVAAIVLRALARVKIVDITR